MSNEAGLRARRAEATLRALAAADLAAVHALVREMAWPHRPADLALLLSLGGGVAATDADGGVIGAGMWWGFGATVGTVGMVLVTGAHQGRGIGRALMEALIAAAGPRALMLNATAEGLALYERLGFVATGLVRQHQVLLESPPVLPAVSAATVRPAVATDHDALHDLDAAAFGARRSSLVARLLADGTTWVSEDNRRVTGFAVRRDFGRGRIVGPVVAPDEDGAMALIAAAARTSGPGVLRLDIPGDAVRLGAWLTAGGLPAISTVTAMCRGSWPAVAAVPRRFGLAMQALG